MVAAGPVILWEFYGCEHLHEGNPQVDDIRPAITWAYFGAGNWADERAGDWAHDLSAVPSRYCGSSPRLAIDTVDMLGVSSLQHRGVVVIGGESMMEQARSIKRPEELALMHWTMSVCEAGMRRMRSELCAGMSEQELWAWLHYENIVHGGEWIETRLLASGPRTNPWMQEASARRMQPGEVLCFDTDLIGPYGHCADVSRAWLVGDAEPTAEQRDMSRYANEQILTNAALLKPGVSFREFSEKAWPIPERFHAQRYSFVAHGVGMCDDYPGIAHWGEDWQQSGYSGMFRENMIISIESFIGEVGGSEGVKLEQQYLFAADGAEDFCSYPFNGDWV